MVLNNYTNQNGRAYNIRKIKNIVIVCTIITNNCSSFESNDGIFMV